jgi:hypothetical protein
VFHVLAKGVFGVGGLGPSRKTRVDRRALTNETVHIRKAPRKVGPSRERSRDGRVDVGRRNVLLDAHETGGRYSIPAPRTILLGRGGPRRAHDGTGAKISDDGALQIGNLVDAHLPGERREMGRKARIAGFGGSGVGHRLGARGLRSARGRDSRAFRARGQRHEERGDVPTCNHALTML